MRHLVFGNPNSRRAKQWQQTCLLPYNRQACLLRNGGQAIHNASFELISYQEVANGQFPKLNKPTTVRITSPGEDFETFQLLVGLGGYPAATALLEERGRILLHEYWYQGWCLILDKIDQFLKENPLAKVMNHPETIKLAFHKANCQEKLRKAGIPIPDIYCCQLNSFEQLLEVMDKQKLHQVFLKPAHSSSASGVMMFRRTANKMMLESTIFLNKKGREAKLFNHKRLQRYQNQETIKTIIDLMIPNRLHIEQWINKKQFQGKSTDFRVVTINQQPVFVQPRHSNHPITNLHLGNEKGSLQNLQIEWGKDLIKKVKTIAIQTAKQLDGLFYAGIDIAINTKGEPYVLEVNAFGDFLKEIFADKKNTYEYELLIWNQQHKQYDQHFNSTQLC